MRNILVTGDRGYIGAVLVPRLIKHGYTVTGLDTEYFKFGFKHKPPIYKKITKDIRKVEKKDLEGIDSIVHLCALSNDSIGEINPNLTEEINFQASVRLAEIAKGIGVKRFIFSSSCSVYGGRGKIPVTENDNVDPLTAYAKSKIETENVLKELANDNFTPVLLRNSTVYGYSPKLRLDLVVNNLVAHALTTKKITLNSDGKAYRPIVHVSDLANFFIQIIKVNRKFIHNQIFNVGSDNQNFLIMDLAKKVQKHLPNLEIAFDKNASSDKRNYKVNFQKLKKTFPEFKFRMGIDDGINELIKILFKYKLTLQDFESGKFIRIRQIKNLLKTHEIDSDLFWV